MRYDDLLHVVHAAATISGEAEIVVIGSQSILGSYPETLPEEMLRSIEADVYPLRAPEKADLIDGAIGDGSQFHAQYGYYAHGVGVTTARPPRGWADRLVRVEVPQRVASTVEAVALCLEPHDLILAKLAANRERDWEFARAAWRAGLLDAWILGERIKTLPVDDALRAIIRDSVVVMVRPPA
jgi:hypothetical protein